MQGCTIPDDAYVMIIGAMKCATTSLYDYLNAHPAICPAACKEPEFFSENQSHGLSVARYQDLWSFDCQAHRYALEASTGYTKFPSEPNVARHIHDHGLWPYFIYVVRNPFDRIASHFNFMSDFDPDWDHAITDGHLIETSNYYLQLEQFRRYFPDDRIHVIDFDDMATQPQTVLKGVYDFLGLFPYYFPEAYEIRNAPRHARW